MLSSDARNPRLAFLDLKQSNKTTYSLTMPEKKIHTDFKTSLNKCSCCPYGFHIDRDFVRYCDTLYNSTQLDKLKQHRRERRKEKKSVEAYLGLGSLKFETDTSPKTQPFTTSTLPHDLYCHNDGLKNAVIDFEDTWQRSLKKSCSGSDIPTTNKNGLKPLHIQTYSGMGGSTPRVVPDDRRFVSHSRSSSTSSVSSQSTAISNPHFGDISQGLLSPVHRTYGTSFSSKSRSSSFSFPVGVNKSTLSNIREQMAASLKRMRELEEQVKTIPILEVKLYALNEEKKSLLNQLKSSEDNVKTVSSSECQSSLKEQLRRLESERILSPTLSSQNWTAKQNENDLSSPGIASCLDATLSNASYTEKTSLSHFKTCTPRNKENQKHVKSIGTSCSVLTREIGIGYVPHKCRSIAVGSEIPFKDIVNSYKSSKSFEQFTSMSSESLESDSESLAGSDERSRFFQSRLSKSPPHDFASKHLFKSYSTSATNTDTKYYNNKSISTDAPAKPAVISKTSRSVSASPTMICKSVQTYSSRVVTSTGSQTLELKIEKPKIEKIPNVKRIIKINASVGDFNINDVSCSNCKKTKKSVGVGDNSINISACSKCNTLKSSSPVKSPIFKHSVTNCQNCVLRQTETVGVGDLDVNHPICQNCDFSKLDSKKNKVQSVGTNTAGDFSSSLSVASSDIHICDKCSATIQSVAQGFAAKTTDSKIPRPSLKTTAISRSSSTSRSNSFKLSKLKTQVSPRLQSPSPTKDIHLTAKEKIQKTTFNKRFEAENLALKLNDEFKKSIQDSSDIKSPDVLPDFTDIPSLPHKKVGLSKEVKAACKVLNDYLQKPERGGEKKTVSSLTMISNEWFKVANQKNSDPLLIEDYLDAFEEFSKLLLHRVVNLSDRNGNTALHYAVSYGNFDVVSILIDSKVCDVNKKNKAGYTSIMLVALAAMKNDTHHYVVQRLFSIGDINEKASQNGQTALMLAVSHGKREIVKILLDTGAEVNLQDKDGSTALMCAAEHGQLEIVKILLSHPECDATIVDNDDCNALAIAMDAGHKDIGLLIYASMNFSRGSSPYSTLKKKRSTPRSTPPPRTPTLRTPPLPSPSARSTNSIPSSFQFPT